jgi:nicotinate-nucleotide--dimethylbenzimidazole phosphoribosyltransferase
MQINRSLISPTAHPALELALRTQLARRSQQAGSLGELESLAVRLGLIQSTMKPQFRAPQMLLFAADHGIAVDGIGAYARCSTADLVRATLSSQVPMAVFAKLHGLDLSVIDCGMAEQLPLHTRLLVRKIAHGTRNARAAAAMSLEQAHAAVRAGTEIAEAMPGNAIVCAGVGVASEETAALVLSRLAGLGLSELLAGLDLGEVGNGNHAVMHLNAVHARHQDVTEAMDVVAAFGGYELAMMAGVMLAAAGKRHLIIADGMSAYAALMVASRIAPAVTDYCVFSRSRGHRGLDRVLSQFNATALLELGLEAMDGTGATLAWPLVCSAAALLTNVVDEAVNQRGSAATSPLKRKNWL